MIDNVLFNQGLPADLLLPRRGKIRPTSTIGEQKKSNPYMNYDSVRQFIRDMSYM